MKKSLRIILVILGVVAIVFSALYCLRWIVNKRIQSAGESTRRIFVFALDVNQVVQHQGSLYAYCATYEYALHLKEKDKVDAWTVLQKVFIAQNKLEFSEEVYRKALAIFFDLIECRFTVLGSGDLLIEGAYRTSVVPDLDNRNFSVIGQARNRPKYAFFNTENAKNKEGFLNVSGNIEISE
jgi:hypothetical protein